MTRETVRSAMPGGFMLLFHFGMLGFAGWLFFQAATLHTSDSALIGIVLVIAFFIGINGFFVVNPNEAKVLQLFGSYVGTVKEPGLRWANPFYSKRSVSQRVVSFESGKLKVNDLDGNPIEIATIIVWKVVDSAHACFDVDDYARYVHVQAEAALRNLATSYAYDAHPVDPSAHPTATTPKDPHEALSLRGNTAEIAEHLKREVQERATSAGVMILDARISHLAYAQEIAHAMLQRQQANAMVSARQRIVDGAVGMVELALERLARNHVVALDDKQKAVLVSNLLVVLCSERGTQPVVSTSSTAA